MSRRWNLYSILATVLLVIVILFVEGSQFDIAVSPQTTQGAAFVKKLLPMGFVLAIVAWIYLLLYTQLYKHPDMFQHRVWQKMPVVLFIIGFLSIVAFLMLGFFGPLMQWVEGFHWLNYIFIIYFIVLLFLFVLTVVRKDASSDHKALHASFLWTAAILIVVTFLM